MKALFLLSNLLIFSHVQAQFWRLMPDYDTLYFASREKFSYKNWSITDMVEVSDYTLGVAEEMDSSGIHIQNLHRGWIPCGHCPGDTIGEWLVSNHYSWLGERILYHNNGLVNGGITGSEWTIDLNAGIGVSWLWMTGDSMRLISVGMDFIYGQPDSVRHYVSDLGDRLKLSRSGGLLEFHFHKEHGFTYRYIGSQKKRDHCYIPSFHQYYTMNMDEWILAGHGHSESFDKFISEGNGIIRLPLQIDRYPDSIRTSYRHYDHYTSHSLQGNPSHNKSIKTVYTTTGFYLKSMYDSLASPFNKRSLDGSAVFFGSHQQSHPTGSNFYLPCYIYPFETPGFFNQYVYSDDPDQDSAGNRLMMSPFSHQSFESFYSILNGRIDHYDVNGFEFSAGGGIYGIYKLTDTMPDTTGYFPVGLQEPPLVSIYPNPFTTQLYVSDVTPYTGWSLLNFQGRKVATGLFESNQIEINGLANGVYLLQLFKTDGSSHFIRVSKE